MILPIEMIGALIPVGSAKSMTADLVFRVGCRPERPRTRAGVGGVRQRAIKGDDPSLAYFEWSVDADTPDDVPYEMATDQAAWAQANPALGIRISAAHIGNDNGRWTTARSPSNGWVSATGRI
jgi:hypothetical protein